jgi:DASS family divalent anion:Na+ symporter
LVTEIGEDKVSTGEQSIEILGAIRGSVSESLPSLKKALGILLAFSIGWLIWNIPPSSGLNTNSVHFLATLLTAVVLWISCTFDEYVVALMLLLSWVILEIAPANVALDGFSHESWFFVVAALGMGAAVNKSGLLRRLSLQILRRIPTAAHKSHTFLLFASGMLITPLLPTGKARALIALPISQAIAQAAGFENRSNGSAALALSAMLGFSHMSFMFLTGAETCLLGWNLLPEWAKSEFGWFWWLIAALPTGIFIFLFVLCAIHFIFPLPQRHRLDTESRASAFAVEDLGPLSRAEWIAIVVLLSTVAGWLTVPLHGIHETWVALFGLLAFLSSGVLDKKTFKNEVDWGLVLFFGIVNSMAIICRYLKVDRWLVSIIEPILGTVTFGPFTFLTAVIIIVFFARFFLRKAAVALILPLLIMPYGQEIGIHPGVVLLTILAAGECFLLAYQDGPYQIAYSSTNGHAFTHRQARKILAVKFVATILGVAISVPYWKMLGLIG